MNNKEIFEKAYKYMDVTLTESNCGLLCNYHCCRAVDENGCALGIYFLPFEYNEIQKNEKLIDENSIEIHTRKVYDLPVGINKMFFGNCKDNTNCIRSLRPIQCRTFPFAPHIENGKLYLIIEKEQEHDCPLIEKKELWNPDFEKSILKGWKELLRIKEIRILIEYDSFVRSNENNILYKYAQSEELKGIYYK
ncbi:hypothetical protein [Helicovermis profundi]|uniref:YkgJ family cysteine cluster protein n=1 Tax=Helicovermis profundi TaxID=3065157 RepID=A0AAU9EKB0_9FIRM|nr:hypothetical protein HLPR_23640 [Clostridia bacterium S502]